VPNPSPAKRIENSLVDALVELSYAVQGVLADVAKEYGLTLAQSRLLGILRDRQPGMLELANHLGLDKSSVSGLIDRAVVRGLVTREPVPGDGRSYRVVITPAGRDLIRNGAATVNRRMTRLVGELNEPQRAQLTAVIRQVLDDAGGLYGPPADPSAQHQRK
jgi:DNA-binding MarR family transcriptional regulator